MKKFLIILITLFTIVVSGCGVNSDSINSKDTTVGIPIKKVSFNEAPFKVQEWARPIIGSPNMTWMHFEDRTYLIVARGKRSTGGYDVKIQTVEVKNQDVVVTYTIIDPKPGQMVTEAITFPYDLGWIPKTDLPIRFEGPDLFNPKYPNEGQQRQ